MSTTDRADIAVVGAGAAGLAAGIFAAEGARAAGTPCRIVLLDGARTIGAKILISGGGRCNVTHDTVRPEDFHGNCRIIRNVLAALPVPATIAWFRSLGVELKREETGKLFPVTDRARTVLDALARRCGELGLAIRPAHRVEEVLPPPAASPRAFPIRHARGTLLARRVILATGGRSLPRTGSDGSGWTIAAHLGHTVTETAPALVPLVLDASFFHAELSGLSQEVELETCVEGKVVDRRTGSLLWTHFGVSGPVVLDASRFWTVAREAGRTVELRAGFWPGTDAAEAEQRLLGRIKDRPRLSLAKTLAQQLPERLVAALCRNCGVDPAVQAGQLRREDRRRLMQAVAGLPLPVVRDRGWNFAEVTAGGVPLEEVDFRTMESRKTPGLHLVGELLDCDGRIGGFNFQWSWATGWLGGRGAAAGLIQEETGKRDDGDGD